jgi:hypothetical protein
MDGYDEQNHSALDYAVYCEDEVTEQVVLQGLANTCPESEVLKPLALIRKMMPRSYEAYPLFL